ncbi:RAD52 family DNA repair protein [Synechococcus sp. HJ21-Hayes]|uniref:RAD52 family DNA repair protein n=1 Tax=Synechococcus sp. HJ21-Hayes TaxID=2823736 RepID=UPI0020CBD336|nr:RAD52 family DNA repair protein [Synechococcus sp. HJ21-Hayes]MCP9852834.1 RAD52 family DNA repair protein [Synechococcus sp. HJ21-Hayes]
MTCTFSTEQIACLSAPLDRAKVKQREQGRSKVSYLEGWQVIAEANRIFGFDGWQRETIEVRCVSQAERTIGRDQRPGWGVTYTARVRVTVGGPTSAAAVIREGCGAGHGIDADLGQAHESALKEAETDAMKRALMTFGNPFGLALYDKQQREVTSGAGSSGDRSSSSQASRPRTTPLRVVPPAAIPPTVRTHGLGSQSQATAKTEPPLTDPAGTAPPPGLDPGLAPLDPARIRQLHATIRTLPAPMLDGFSKAFRKRFQVPADAPSIADRICQQRHHDWIEAFLVQHHQG